MNETEKRPDVEPQLEETLIFKRGMVLQQWGNQLELKDKWS